MNPIYEAAEEIALNTIQATEEEVHEAVLNQLKKWGIHPAGNVEKQLTKAVREARTALFVEIAKHVTAKE